MEKLVVIFIAFVLTVHASPRVANKELVLTLFDDFDDFNLSLWKHELSLWGGGNWEFQYYNNNRTNSYTKDGILTIQPTLLEADIGIAALKGGFNFDVWGSSPATFCTAPSFYGCFRTSGAGGNYLNPIKSARIRTAESFSFTYGKVEVRAKLPVGDWLWPAIWMLPTDEQYGNWPASGEIDIMESRGNNASYAAGGNDHFSSTLHWGLNYFQNRYPQTSRVMQVENLTTEFHTFGFVWTDTYMGTYLDNETNTVLEVPVEESFWSLGAWDSPPWNNPWQGRGNNAPFDRRFYLAINLACGGTNGYFPDDVGGKPWNNTSPHAVNEFYDDKDQWHSTWTSPFEIDWVKVWTYEEIESYQYCRQPANRILLTCSNS